MTTTHFGRTIGARSRVAAATIAVASLALAGCSVGDGNDLTLATGSTGGTYFPLGGEIASVWSNNIDDISVTATVGGASVENLRALDQGEVQLIMSVNATAADAVTSSGDFADNPLADPADIRALGNIYPEILQIVTTRDSGISSIEDLRGKRVEMGPLGSATSALAAQVLEAYGINPATDLDATLDSGFGDAATNLGDGVVDAAFGILAAPTGSIEQLATTNDVVLLDIQGAALDRLLAENPLLSPHQIPGGTYRGVDNTNRTVTAWATLYAKADLDDELAYELVRVMYENARSVQHSAARDMLLNTAVDGLGPVEVHPGAVRFYEEQGISVR
ncbi:TAXI family TRAP transporter solute-binding subunit [Hoyosella rhizosphaerae]|uniref:C4-dicarboxylate ABC transporter substrate-binding protein n=1 Tax=Hoyosella rhizosphaerae TaxID=1755582 RepID=A0A916XBS8_9ACTN|nr:TAXI family TRAP transporter solute-binding subunit [Hoyosella rhizosphaerae]MBN4926338.1 TAXI family TRAP transporter solute-binding subunit [Hoyosella rhizosphaerae]GGC60142.1 C4-dicarboxylate ABC transporter substrate-binding protein [Hoyosella rhizosphaerae]